MRAHTFSRCLVLSALACAALACGDDSDRPGKNPDDDGFASGGGAGGSSGSGRAGAGGASVVGGGVGGRGTSGGAGGSRSDVGGRDGGGSAGNTADAGQVGGDAGGGSSGVWRPFSDDSPWNTPIGPNPAIDPESDAMIADFVSSSPFGPHLGVNLEQFSVPLYYADANTPRVTMVCNVGGLGLTGNDGLNAMAMIPMPEGAVPDPQSDAHILIVDRSTNTEWGFWHAANAGGGQWTCGTGASLDLGGTGVRTLAQGNPTWYTSHGPRACGFGLVNGLIRTEEIEAGVIEHALVIAYPHIRAGLYTPPASTAQAHVGDQAIMTRGIPCGGRMQYDPSVDPDGLGLTPAGRAIVVALQTYGAYVGDFSGGLSLYADNSPDARAFWGGGVLSGDSVDGIDLTAFRVIELGMLYDNGNGI